MTRKDEVKVTSVALLEQQARGIVRDDPVLADDARLAAGILKEVLNSPDELLAPLTEDIRAVRRLPSAWDSRVGFLLSFGFATPTYALIIFFNPESLSDQDRDLQTSVPLLALATLISIALAWAKWRERKTKQLAIARLREKVRVQLIAAITFAKTEATADSKRWSDDFSAAVAPALVEKDLQEAVSFTGYAKVLDFVASHDTSAVGIAGARGSGKSTLMQQLRFDPAFPCIGIRVPVPVHHGAGELVRLLHGELAEEAYRWARENERRVGARWSWRQRALPAARKVLLPIARWLALLLVAIVLLFVWLGDREDMRTIDDYRAGSDAQLARFQISYIGLAALLGMTVIATFLAVKAWRVFQGRALLAASPTTVGGLATQQLAWLRWVTTAESASKTSFKIDTLGFEGQNKLTRMERDRGDLDAIRALRLFISDLVLLSPEGISVLICVDELDKVADAADAVKTINSVKDLFHIPGAHFLVSVSSDALLSFAARGVPVRDVFDSSFDAVIRMPALTFKEAGDLIAHRDSDVTLTAVLFSYAWSGGNARDLIRSARHCVEVRRDHGRDLPIGQVVGKVLAGDLAEVLEAAVQRLQVEGLDAELEDVLAFQELLDDQTGELTDVLAAALRDARLPVFSDRTSEAQMLAAALDPYARIAALTAALFGQRRTPEQWSSAAVRTAAEALAVARAGLGRHPAEMRRLVRKAVTACAAVLGEAGARQFEPLPPEPATRRTVTPPRRSLTEVVAGNGHRTPVQPAPEEEEQEEHS
ncbi:hypothetical protein [Actinoplanes sp. M2I2]|uniref:hypothetical protein n=1 Tax=Actinoplanes sp. M2I2 TaxID=1734444 RepID=UPI002021D6B0|nr:hypothetical protein [Actinoplanes sp. M2I2]